MLKIEKFVTMSPEQWEIVIEGMRNPKNSWDRIDSYSTYLDDPLTHDTAALGFFLGENDEGLMKSLAKGGPVHAKYRRMMPVWITLSAPLYWWKEFDAYKVGVVTNSCSTMHKIHAKEFTLDDFSCEYMIDHDDILADDFVNEGGYLFSTPFDILTNTIEVLNRARDKYLEYLKKPTKDAAAHKQNVKRLWYQLIQLLPSSYNQKRTVMVNYEVLYNMYQSRRHHKLTDWHTFCDFCEELPESELITMPAEEEEE